MADTTLQSPQRIGPLVLNRPTLVAWFFYLLLVLLVALFFVWSRLQGVYLDYGICQLEDELRALQKQSSRLQVEVATLSSSGRLERVARESLGLQLPTPEQIIPVR